MPTDADTDELLDRAGRGDAVASAQLLDRHRNRLRRMVAVRLDRRLIARLDPSDIVQEALAEAHVKLSDYLRDRPIPFYPWLRRLAWEHLVRLHQRHLHTARRSVLREEDSLTGAQDKSSILLAEKLAAPRLAPDRRILEAELRMRVLSALERLAERDREILVLRYLEELTNAEIAATLGINEGAVRVRHTRALDRIARFVGQNDLPESEK